MKDTKKILTFFSFYDKTRIEHYLEEQAQNGWLLEKIHLFWRFRRIQPQNMHFSVSYFPKASSFDPAPSEQQLLFQDFCEHTGWKLAASNAQMQIFYNEKDTPIPIETDASLEIAQIHASAKKNFLPFCFLLVLAALINMGLFGLRLTYDALSVLTSNTYLLYGVCWFLVFLISFSEIIAYFKWHKKALQVAESNETFMETNAHTHIPVILSFFMLTGYAFLLISYGGKQMSLIALSTFVMILGVTTLIHVISEQMKRWNLSAKLNCAITIIITLVIGCGFTSVFIIGCIEQVAAVQSEKIPADTYEFRNHTFKVYHDELPLTLEDLTEITYDGYSYRIQKNDKSILAQQLSATQRPRMDALEQPSLEYKVTTVNLPFLYPFVKTVMLQNLADNYAFSEEEDTSWQQHKEMDPAPWNANEAYQLWIYGEAEMRFLLCYDRSIVELSFDDDWKLTEEQKEVIGRTF